MDPNTYFEEDPEDPRTPTNEFTDQALVEKIIEKHAPKFEVFSDDRVMRVLVLDNGSLPLAALREIRDLGLEKGLDVVVAEEPTAKREVLIHDGSSLASSLLELLKDVRFEEPVKVSCAVEEAAEQPPAPPKAKLPSFRQFQNSRHNHGPSTRRQFAQIRPPRRGGR